MIQQIAIKTKIEIEFRPDHHVGICGTDPGGRAAADAAHIQQQRHRDSVYGLPVYIYLCQLRYWLGGLRYGDPLVCVRTVCAAGADSDRRYGRYYRDSRRDHDLRQEDIFDAAQHHAGCGVGPSDGRHCPLHRLYFEGYSAD